MSHIFISPSKYIQGRDELKNIAKYLEPIGIDFFCIISPKGLERVGLDMENYMTSANMKIHFSKFAGECTQKEIDLLISKCRSAKVDAVIGVGGGKNIDVAKAVAHICNLPVIIIPTIASTDAPCSALSIIYNEDKSLDTFLFLKRNPDIVLVDCNIIAQSPARFIVAGMGDAFSTYIEAKASARAGGITCAGGKTTNAAIAIANMCYEIIKTNGLKAKIAAENHLCNTALENVIEANILLSGIGFESGGLCIAHPINNGFSLLEDCKHLYHGEKVAFGALVQLVLENVAEDAIYQEIAFLHSIGLPITLADMGVTEDIHNKLEIVANDVLEANGDMHNLSMDLCKENIMCAIMIASELGKKYLENRP